MSSTLRAEYDFVVLGEGLAAGCGSFSLSSDGQRTSFPALMAAQMGVRFLQTLIQPPGIGETIGFPAPRVVLPSPLQSTVIETMPPVLPANLAVPGMTVSDVLRRRPTEPLISRECHVQTALNLLLGATYIYEGVQGETPTPLEMALLRRPKLALVELGNAEVLRAATTGTAALLPQGDGFRRDYSEIISRLRNSGARVIVLTIPDPLDTAYFSTVAAASEVARIDARLLQEMWSVPADAFITVHGLMDIGFQIMAAVTGTSRMGAIRALPQGSILEAREADRLREGVKALNGAIKEIADANDCLICDLGALFGKVKRNGLTIGHRRITAGYLEGYYCLNGYFPGAAGHAVIANEILVLLNRSCGSRFRPVNVARVIKSDSVAGYRRAAGPKWTRATLVSPPPIPVPEPASAAPSGAPAQGPPAAIETKYAIQLPPDLEQVLDLNPAASYFGDALTAQDCRTPETIKWGSGYNLLFGGLAMMDSHLSGKIRVRFTPPQNGWTTFQIDFPGGLRGTDGVLAAPSFFRMPGNLQSVNAAPDPMSWGRLNLATGEADAYSGKVSLYTSLFNTALFALLRVNPKLPKAPVGFPGQYGSAFVNFAQRCDGKLDVTFCGTTFLPLGAGACFPLSFCGANWDFAAIPAPGTVLHPHISITTSTALPASDTADKSAPPEIPFNTVQEYTLFSPISCFGDLFNLRAPELGGPALGRSRLLGRLQIQFGPKAGNSVPIAVSLASAGGVLAPLDPTPIAEAYPGRLMPGPEGFGAVLRFPERTYPQNDLFVADDMFDISVGALDLATGDLIHPLVHRGFINQDVIFALLRVEPRTRRDSFHFRGPGSLRRHSSGNTLFRCFAQIYVPYPKGNRFPDPNFATGFRTEGERLDPYLWMWAIEDSLRTRGDYNSRGDRILSPKGELFSWRLSIPASGKNKSARFVYENHSSQSSFTMRSLTWIGFANSGTGTGRELDTVSLSCFGIWRTLHGNDRVVQAAIQLSKADAAPWFGIQIARAEIGDADTPLPETTFPVPALGGVSFTTYTAPY